MFSIPKHGWVDISIGDWSDRSSYLTDPHLDMLDAFITLYGSYNPGAVYCDAEGWEYIIVISFNDIFIIEQKDEDKLITLDVRTRDLCEEVIADIEGHLKDWSMWSYSVDNEEDRVKDENEIKEKLAKLREVLAEYDNRRNCAKQVLKNE